MISLFWWAVLFLLFVAAALLLIINHVGSKDAETDGTDWGDFGGDPGVSLRARGEAEKEGSGGERE